MGTGKVSSARELTEGKARPEDDDDESSDEEPAFERILSPERPVGEVLDDPERRQRIMEAASLFAPSSSTAAASSSSSSKPVFGSALASGALDIGLALARGPDGQPLIPVTRKRKRRVTQRERKRLRDKAADEASSDEESDFDSSESSEDDEESEQRSSQEFQQQSTSDSTVQPTRPTYTLEEGEDTDSEEEAIFMEAMRLRGMAPPSEDDDDDDSEAGPSYSDRDTDSEEEAVLMEAMRRRGLALPSEDEDDSDDDLSRPIDAQVTMGTDDAPQKAAASPPWDGFASEDDDAAGSTSGSEADDDAEEASDDDEEDEEDDGGSEESAADEPSRRRGIQRTERSSGFKDWARTALGFGAEGDGLDGPAGRTEEGAPLEPVMGLKVKVGDIGPQDGVARGPLGEQEASASEQSPFAAKYYTEIASSKAVRNVPIQRKEEIIESRLKLPIVQEEERIVRTILENEVSVICGETGSGKTTQVAQMLFERGFGTPGSDNPGLVGVTQPRRVAAVSTARRVAEELNLPPNRVSHQIRYDGTVSPQTSLKFMTDGVLLRELASDLLLTKYSVVIVDEAHERSVNTDVLIGMLSRVVKLRASRWLEGKEGARPLRLIIMSATLRVADFAENPALFAKPPPLLKIEARQHPVTVHFNRRTPSDYLEETVKKASKIHNRLPPGGILIFLTGEQEIKTVCKELEAKFGQRAIDRQAARNAGRASRLGRGRDDDQDESTEARVQVRPGREDVETEEIALGDTGVAQDDGSNLDGTDEADGQNEDVEALDTDSEAEDVDQTELDREAPVTASTAPMHILPLYSLLPSERQLQVFDAPPEGSRLVVVATNVAETSLTIPNIRYVIDCGRAKERKYDGHSGISSFKVDWVSKASASQRAGRAGRTGPGHCYRLYSSNVYEEYLQEFAVPEVRRTPVEGLVLQMKSMNIDNVINFPFPTSPDRMAIAKAERVLTRLGALTLEGSGHKQVARISDLGRTMSLFPLNPRFAKILVQGQQHGCLPYLVALVAAMSVGDLFVREENAHEAEEDDDQEEPELHNPALRSQALQEKEERKAKRRRRFEALARFDSLGGTGISDAFRTLAVVGAYAFAGGSLAFCKENFLRPKAMEEVRLLRRQLASLVLSTLPPSNETTALHSTLANPRLSPPTATQFKVIRQLICCAYIDRVAVRADLMPEAARGVPSLADSAAEGRLKGKWKNCRGVPYLGMGVQGEEVYLHPSSSLAEHSPPEWLVFEEVTRSRGKTRKSKTDQDGEEEEEEETKGRVYIKGLTTINPSWIAKLGKDLCSFSKPTSLDDGPASQSLATNIAALKRGGTSGANGKGGEELVVMTPTYGTGPACEPSERATMIGWELPMVKAKRRFLGGLKGWQVDLV